VSARGAWLVVPFALALSLAPLAIGCRPRPSRVPVLLVGPMQEPPSVALFERLVQAARAEGYAPMRVEPRYGSFAVRPRVSEPAGVAFEVQCFLDGRVQVRVAGVDRSPSTGIALVPPALRTEAVRFAQTLEAGGGGGTL
jgi:hypothetical protein